MKLTRLFYVLLAVLLLALIACGGDTVTTDEPPGESVETDQEEAVSVEEDEAAEEPTEESMDEAPPITIGLITDLSGRFVTFGKDINVATTLAVEAINNAGGVNGSMLQIEVIDTGGEPDQAVIGLRELVDEGVFAVSGPLSSGEAEVLFVQAAQLGIPLITGTANKEGITELGEGWAFRNTATNTALYSVALPAWAEAYGVETAVLVYDEAEPVSAAAAQFSIPGVAPQVGIEIVNADAPITFARGQTDFATTVQRIKDTEADGIILMSAPAEAGLIARELARQDETRPIIGHPAQNSNTFFEQGGADINDWVLPSIFDPRTSDADSVAYIEAISAADSEPPTVPEAANYYDNILMLAEVMRAAGIDGNSSPEEARAAIQAGLLALAGFDGVAGETTFGGSNDADKTVYVYVVKAGASEPLE